MFLLSCGKSVEKQIRDGVRTIDQASFGKKQVQVTEILRKGDHAVATVTIETAVKLIRKNGNWTVEQVRIGDRKWEEVDTILAVFDKERTRKTCTDLEQIGLAIGRYREELGKLPHAATFRELMDVLAPKYLHPMKGLDGWFAPYLFRSISTSEYDLRSSGPDGVVETPDDLILERHR